MPKRIAFFADGTWDSATNDTNVYKMFKASQLTSEQLALYDDGVGSDGTLIERLFGGAFGAGLFQKVKDGYTRIAHVYEEGDDVFIFGFSRGAYTARSLAGMVATCGLPTKSFDQNLVDTAFLAYRQRDKRQELLAGLGSYNLYDAPIKMVGVWDTVGALGIPSLVGDVDPILYGFLDTGLHPDVKNAFHALAIDERRREFPPTLWTPQDIAGQTVEQIWFSGVHCDVGGGYNETGLSNIALGWMMSKAESLGLQFEDAARQQYLPLPRDAKLSLDTIHESWSLLWGFPKSRSIDPRSSLSNSVAVRSAYGGYRPANLTLPNGVPAQSYTIIPIVGSPPA